MPEQHNSIQMRNCSKELLSLLIQLELPNYRVEKIEDVHVVYEDDHPYSIVFHDENDNLQCVKYSEIVLQ